MDKKARDTFLNEYHNDYGETISKSEAKQILISLESNYYSDIDDIYSEKHIYDDICNNLFNRQKSFEKYLIPWIGVRIDLSKRDVVDIGCGTGSSAAAIARYAKSVTAYEIDKGPCQVAIDRAKSLNLRNMQVVHVDPSETIDRVREKFPSGCEVVTLIAVLEHMTELERKDFLPEIWKCLKPGGVLVIAEVPNRLSYLDEHTAKLPFFHFLPTDVKVEYSNRSPRRIFSESIAQTRIHPSNNMNEVFSRWGIGLSYHDFEIGFEVDDLNTILMADGYEHATIAWFPPSMEERILVNYFVEKPVLKPIGFCRNVLNIMFVKPYDGMPKYPLNHDEKHIMSLFSHLNYPTDAAKRILRRRT